MGARRGLTALRDWAMCEAPCKLPSQGTLRMTAVCAAVLVPVLYVLAIHNTSQFPRTCDIDDTTQNKVLNEAQGTLFEAYVPPLLNLDGFACWYTKHFEGGSTHGANIFTVSANASFMASMRETFTQSQSNRALFIEACTNITALWQGWWIMHAYGCGAPNASARCQNSTRAQNVARDFLCESMRTEAGRAFATARRLQATNASSAAYWAVYEEGNVDACVAQVLEGLAGSTGFDSINEVWGWFQGALVGQSACSQLKGGVKLASLISVAAGTSCDLGAGYTVAYWVFIYAAKTVLMCFALMMVQASSSASHTSPRRAFFSRILGRGSSGNPLAYHADVEMSRSPKAAVADSAHVGSGGPGVAEKMKMKSNPGVAAVAGGDCGES